MNKILQRLSASPPKLPTLPGTPPPKLTDRAPLIFKSLQQKNQENRPKQKIDYTEEIQRCKKMITAFKEDIAEIVVDFKSLFDELKRGNDRDECSKFANDILADIDNTRYEIKKNITKFVTKFNLK